MMRPAHDLPEVWLCTAPIDFRKGMYGLASLVEAQLGTSPFSGRLFIFTNRRRTGVKILYWEKNGFCLWQKRLERERFHWLRSSPGQQRVSLTGQQLNWLLDGYDLNRMKPHQALPFSSIL